LFNAEVGDEFLAFFADQELVKFFGAYQAHFIFILWAFDQNLQVLHLGLMKNPGAGVQHMVLEVAICVQEGILHEFISVLLVGAIHELPLHDGEEKTSLAPAMPG
jgi:hypothetical protein